jgi:hypothetical protein
MLAATDLSSLHEHFDDKNVQRLPEGVEGAEGAPVTKGWRLYGSFGTLCLASFIVAVDATVVSVALPVRTFP